MEYSKLVDIYEQLNTTTKRLEKTHIISEFLKDVSADDIEHVILLLEGRVFPSYDSMEIGIAARLMLKSLNVATGISVERIEKEWKKFGDLGKVAEEIVKTKKQATLHSAKLTVKKVFDNIRKLAELEGEGTVDRKTQLIAELLTSAKPVESKYIVKTILGEMRIGVGEGSMRDAITWAFFGHKTGVKYTKEGNDIEVEDRDIYNKYLDAVQHAYDVTNEFALVAKAAKQKGLEGLENIGMKVGIPIQVMLALKVDTIEEAFETVGKPAAIEFKYDGYRIKFKSMMETLDLAIVGAEWGQGKRSKWLSSYVIACIDENGNFLEVGRASTGLKEKEKEGLSFVEMTRLLKPLTIFEKGKEVKVKPKIVIEVGYDEIQKSPTYESGFALRFPRVIQIREDKGPDEVSTLDYVKKLYNGQKKS